MNSAALITIAAVAFLFGILLFAIFARWRARCQGETRRRRGATGELRAASLLTNQGYRIVNEHPTITYTFWVNGQATNARLVPDLMVERGGRRFVVEVKTGQGARPTVRGTRRQLLEYACHFPEAGLLLVDADQGQVLEICFPEHGKAPLVHSTSLVPAIITLLTGLVAGGALMWFLG